MEPIVLFSDDRLKIATVYESQDMFIVNYKDTIHRFEVSKKYNVLEYAIQKANEWVGL